MKRQQKLLILFCAMMFSCQTRENRAIDNGQKKPAAKPTFSPYPTVDPIVPGPTLNPYPPKPSVVPTQGPGPSGIPPNPSTIPSQPPIPSGSPTPPPIPSGTPVKIDPKVYNYLQPKVVSAGFECKSEDNTTIVRMGEYQYKESEKEPGGTYFVAVVTDSHEVPPKNTLVYSWEETDEKKSPDFSKILESSAPLKFLSPFNDDPKSQVIAKYEGVDQEFIQFYPLGLTDPRNTDTSKKRPSVMFISNVVHNANCTINKVNNMMIPIYDFGLSFVAKDKKVYLSGESKSPEQVYRVSSNTDPKEVVISEVKASNLMGFEVKRIANFDLTKAADTNEVIKNFIDAYRAAFSKPAHLPNIVLSKTLPGEGNKEFSLLP